MKTFSQTLKLSFLAMLCGCIACNILFWAGMVLSPNFESLQLQAVLLAIPGMALSTGFVILLAWLVIFLPVDLLVSAQSKLRRPFPAALCGFIAGSSVLAAPWAVLAWKNDVLHLVLKQCLEQLPSSLLTPGITGMVAAYVRSRHREPSSTMP